MKRRVILLGPPGSGKGTIAAQLQQRFGLPHVSSGHLLRKEAESGSPVGKRVQMFLEKGELVPDAIVLELMAGWWNSAPLENGFMLDGFPRALVQAQALDDWLLAKRAPIEVVLLYDCNLEVVLDRITGRLSCPSCGRVYHIRSLPPKVAGRCDAGCAALIQRSDDSESVTRKRFEIYARQAEPMVTYYRHQGKLAVIDATKPPADRFEETVRALN